jgi:hypothetical protein
MDPAIGATNLRTCLCSIAPAEEGSNYGGVPQIG